MIVMKFGGSSLQSPEVIQQAIAIVRSRMLHGPLLVVSALGKVTDRLLHLGREAAAGHRQHWVKTFSELKEYHASVAIDLVRDDQLHNLRSFLAVHFDELEIVASQLHKMGGLTPAAQDAITSFGERLSSGIIAMALKSSGTPSAYLDARALICTDGQHTFAAPLLPETYLNIRHAIRGLPPGTVPVLGGFIGTSVDGRTTTMGRNSSNLTAVLAAAAVRAEWVEMWTDVDGVFRHDPRHILDQYPLPELSFLEALELAKNGARVLHHGAVLLASQVNIPIHIKNASRPESPGTRISAEHDLPRSANTGAWLGSASSD